MKNEFLKGKTARTRRREIVGFVEFLENNPEVEEQYMQGIRAKAQKNKQGMDKFYLHIIDVNRPSG